MKNDKILKAIKDSGVIKTIRASKALFNRKSKAQNVLFVEKGLILLNNPETGNLRLIGSEQFLGLREALSDDCYQNDATAYTDSEVYFIKSDDFMNLMQKDPQLRNYFIKYLSKDMEASQIAFE